MDMPMSSTSMAMASMSMASMTGMTPTSTASAAMSSSSSMSSMDMDMGSGDCQISMLWNWYTIDACFLTSSWHVTTRGQFAGSCIGVILLVIVLEGLRRLSKEYDRLILRQYRAAHFSSLNRSPSPSGSGSSSSNEAANAAALTSDGAPAKNGAAATTQSRAFSDRAAPPMRFRANVMQQMVRALLHMLQFACAYFIMLLAMYFNGYIIICIFIGAYIGAFIFSWESMELGGNQEDVTVCCG